MLLLLLCSPWRIRKPLPRLRLCIRSSTHRKLRAAVVLPTKVVVVAPTMVDTTLQVERTTPNIHEQSRLHLYVWQGAAGTSAVMTHDCVRAASSGATVGVALGILPPGRTPQPTNKSTGRESATWPASCLPPPRVVCPQEAAAHSRLYKAAAATAATATQPHLAMAMRQVRTNHDTTRRIRHLSSLTTRGMAVGARQATLVAARTARGTVGDQTAIVAVAGIVNVTGVGRLATPPVAMHVVTRCDARVRSSLGGGLHPSSQRPCTDVGGCVYRSSAAGVLVRRHNSHRVPVPVRSER